MKAGALLLIALMAPSGVHAQGTLVDPVPILIPIHVGDYFRGAFGSIWATEAHAFNSSPSSIVYFGAGCNLGIICPGLHAMPAGTSSLLNIYVGNPGYLLWVSRADERSVHVAVRMFETSRNTIPGGVAIPAVRDADFREVVAFPAVPKRAGQRYQLRIYGIPAQPTPQAESYLVTTANRDGEVIRELTVTAHSRTPDHWGAIEPMSLPVVPIFGSAALDDAITQAPDPSVVVTVRALSGSRLWAFVAMTDNESQAVSLALPD